MKVKFLIISCVAVLLLSSCPGRYACDITAELSFTPSEPIPGEEIVIKCSNYNIFDYDKAVNDSKNETEFYNTDCFSISQNMFSDDHCIYTYHNPNGSRFKEKKSNREAVYSLLSNAVSSYISHSIMREPIPDECGQYKSLFDYVTYNPSYLHISYPKHLALNKPSAKAGDKVTVTSVKPFFDEDTFSDEKVSKLFDANYYIVWYSADNIIEDGAIVYGSNIEKKPVPNIAIDLDSLTPTSVTFTIPDDAITGTIHVLNEGGFVVDGTNDIGLVGNVEGAYAYYSTATELTITK